jgi:predicted TIM-barrel enzyme
VEKSLSIISNIIQAIFGKEKAIIGVVHCLSGSPRNRDTDFKSTLQRALDDARAYADGGVEGLIIENHGDTGQRTEDAASIDEIQAIRSSSSLPLLVGSGVTFENVETILPLVDRIILASALKRDGLWWNEVEKGRVSALCKAREIRVRIEARR